MQLLELLLIEKAASLNMANLKLASISETGASRENNFFIHPKDFCLKQYDTVNHQSSQPCNMHSL